MYFVESSIYSHQNNNQDTQGMQKGQAEQLGFLYEDKVERQSTRLALSVGAGCGGGGAQALHVRNE
jgi:hypothetical protein